MILKVGVNDLVLLLSRYVIVQVTYDFYGVRSCAALWSFSGAIIGKKIREFGD